MGAVDDLTLALVLFGTNMTSTRTMQCPGLGWIGEDSTWDVTRPRLGSSAALRSHGFTTDWVVSRTDWYVFCTGKFSKHRIRAPWYLDFRHCTRRALVAPAGR